MFYFNDNNRTTNEKNPKVKHNSQELSSTLKNEEIITVVWAVQDLGV